MNNFKNNSTSKQGTISLLPREYKCKKCDKVFNHRFDLVKHRKIHLSSEQYKDEHRREMMNHIRKLLQI